MACLVILHRSRVGHPSVTTRSVEIVWRLWSFFAVLFETFSLDGVWRGILKFLLD